MRRPLICSGCKGNYGCDREANWAPPYVQSITAKLRTNSLTEVLQDESLLYALGQKVGECTRCQERANEIFAIHNRFKKVVAQVIAEVDVKMLFT